MCSTVDAVRHITRVADWQRRACAKRHSGTSAFLLVGRMSERKWRSSPIPQGSKRKLDPRQRIQALIVALRKRTGEGSIDVRLFAQQARRGRSALIGDEHHVHRTASRLRLAFNRSPSNEATKNA